MVFILILPLKIPYHPQNDPGRICQKKLSKSLTTTVPRGLILSSSFARRTKEFGKTSLHRHVALSETGTLPTDCSNAFAVCVGADRRGRALSWWTMPSKGSQVARARNIDGEMVVSHEGPYKRPPRRTVAASKDHHVRMASPPLPPPEATPAMETHPIRAPREGL